MLALAIVGVWSATAVAQSLNDTCTVSIFNRTARVAADGSWELPNVPAGFGLIRARATCVGGGMTTSGQSDFFTITANRMNAIRPIQVGLTTPIPLSLTLTAPTTTLTSAGATTQLTVTANFPDSSTNDVTAASTGTSYTISNPAIASIDQGGLVMANTSGTVVISAMNEGALGLFQLQVILSGDSDGDGIPDDVELALGLDPNNPVDAIADPDADGLSTADEVAIGTDPNNSDSDGDGILDGEEVIAGVDGFVTNPLLADTDGDNIRDALEISTGSDPTDKTSFNLAGALNAIEVTPSIFELTFNTVIGEASRQLSVVGTLLDNTTIDLTSTTIGTNYVSDDLSICNFGAMPGQVFAGQPGTCTITAINNGFTADATGMVMTFSPTALGVVAIPGFANNVDVQGDVAYVAAGSAGLHVVDVSDRTVRCLVGDTGCTNGTSFDTPGNANDVKVVGNTVYVADGVSGLRLFDITNDPLSPIFLGEVDTPGNALDVVVRGTLAYVADGASGLQVIDVSTPSAPVIIGSVDTPILASGVDVRADGQLGVIADRTVGIHVLDLTDPTTPFIQGSVDTGDAHDVALDTGFVLVADGEGSMTSVSLADPTQPAVVSRTPRDTGGLLRDVVRLNGLAFGADVFRVNGVPIVDASDPTSLVPRAILDFSSIRDDNGTGIAVDPFYVYLTAAKGVSTRLYIGQYLSIDDTAGIPPTVNITAPSLGESFMEGTVIPVTVDAQDDVGVVGVQFLVDGVVVSTDSTAPYEASFVVPVGSTSLTLGATALDLGGNQGTAEDVVVNVIPDPPPKVTVTAPGVGQEVIEEATVPVTVDAVDNGTVVAVDLLVDGEVFTDTEVPYEFEIVIPVGVSTLPIEARARDQLGREGFSDPVTLSVIPDPLTTLVGQVQRGDGTPVDGARVSTLGGLSSLTIADGSFTIPNVSTVKGDITVAASLVDVGGTLLRGTSAAVPPVRSAVTDVGTVVLQGLTTGSPQLEVFHVMPPPGTPSWVVDRPLMIRFSDPLDVSTVNDQSIFLMNEGTGTPVAGTLAMNLDETEVTFTPTSALPFGTAFTLNLTQGLRSQEGELALGAEFMSPFTTANTIWVVNGTTGDDTAGDGSPSNPFASIQRALQEASSGEVVTVASGLYEESFTVKSEVTVQGAGPGQTIIDHSGSSPLVEMEANTALLSLTVQNGDGVGVMGQGVPFIIGEVHILNTSESLDAIRFGNSGPLSTGDIVVSGSTLSDTGAIGASIFSNDVLGNILFMGNTIAASLGITFESSAINVECGNLNGDLSFIGNRLPGDHQFGLRVNCDVLGRLTVRHNEIRDQQRGGILLFNVEGHVDISDNRFSGNSNSDISLDRVAQGLTINRNEFHGDIEFQESLEGSVRMEGNRFSDGEIKFDEIGIEGDLTFLNNIFTNASLDMEIEEDVEGNLTIQDNVFMGRGITESKTSVSGNLIITGNEIRDSSGTALDLDRSCGAVFVDIRDNIITGSPGMGILFDGCTVTGQVINNTITDNLLTGLVLKNGSPLIQGNLIARNGVTTSTSPFLLRPENLSGLSLTENASPILRNNTFDNNSGPGVLSEDNAQPDLGTAGDFGGNTFTGNGTRDPNVFGDINNDTMNVIPAQGNQFDHETALEIDVLDIVDDEEGQAQGRTIGIVDFNNFLDFTGNPVEVVTTVVGTVVDSAGQGIAGASITVSDGITGTTDAVGSFSIPGVSALLGKVRVRANATLDGVPSVGFSGEFSPVEGGITNVGPIVLNAAPLALTDGTSTVDQPMPAVDVNGNIHVVWVDDRTGNDEIFYTMLSSAGVTLIDATKLTNDFAKSKRPALGIDSQNRVHVVWQDRTSGPTEIFYLQLDPSLDDQDGSTSDRATLLVVGEDDFQLSTAGGTSQHPRLVVDGLDRVHVVWADSSPQSVHYAQLASEGSITIPDTTIYTGGSSFQIVPDLAVDSQNHVHVVWSKAEVSYAMVDGRTGAVLISDTPLSALDNEESRFPTIAVDPDDRVTVVYQDARFTGRSELVMQRLDPSLDDQNGDFADLNQIQILRETLLTDPDDALASVWPDIASDDFGRIVLSYLDQSDGVSDQLGTQTFRMLNKAGVTLSEQILSMEDSAATTTKFTIGFVATQGISAYVTWTDKPEGGTEQVLLQVINPDLDRDGLTDAQEGLLETDPTNPDSNNNGVLDGDEDSDSDGLSDSQELQNGLDPQDGSDAVGDLDSDDLSNENELTLGTATTLPDSDADVLTDGEEVNIHGTDPLNPDTDLGGRKDGEEVLMDSTDPLDPSDDLVP